MQSVGPRQFSAADLSILLVVLIWGTNFAVVKAAFDQIPPLAFMAVRFSVASLLITAALYWREGHMPLPGRMYLKLIVLGLIGNTLYQIFFITAIDHTSATNTSLVLAATPAIVALAGSLLNIEPGSWKIRIGIALAIGGITIVLSARGIEFSSNTLQGDLLAVGATLTWSAYTLGVRAVSRSVSPLRVTAITMLSGTPLLIAVGFTTVAETEWSAVSPLGWAGLFYSGLMALVVAYFLWNLNVQRVGSSRTAIYIAAVPLVATVTAWITLGERLTALQFVGAAFIILGVLLTQNLIPRLPRLQPQSVVGESS